MDSKRIETPRAAPVLPGSIFAPRWRMIAVALFVVAYVAATALVAHSDLGVQSLVLVAAVFGVLAISLDLVAGMLELDSLGQGGFFAIGAYLTTIVVNDLGWNVFPMLVVVLAVTGLVGLAVGAMSLRVSGLYFAITTFIFTLVLTVLATDLKITGGLQGLLGPAFPDFPEGLEALGTPIAWCAMLALLLCMGVVWNIRQSPLYPVLLSIRDAERFAEAAGARTSLIKIGVFGVSAAMAGAAGWVFSFLGVVSPGQFDWAVSLNILVMVLIGGINTTLGPVIGAAFVSMFPALVNINPWLQEIVYGALSILAVTLLPGGLMSLVKARVVALGESWSAGPRADAAHSAPARALDPALFRKIAPDTNGRQPGVAEPEYAVECRGIQFSYGGGLRVLRDVDLAVRRGQIHGLIGPNGSGKSTLANVIAGRLQPLAGTTLVKGVRVDGAPASRRAKLGMRRTFQAAELVRELTPTQNVMVGLFGLKPRIVARAAFWPTLPSGRRDMAWMEGRSRDALEMVGAAAGSDEPSAMCRTGRAADAISVGVRRRPRHHHPRRAGDRPFDSRGRPPGRDPHPPQGARRHDSHHRAPDAVSLSHLRPGDGTQRGRGNSDRNGGRSARSRSRSFGRMSQCIRTRRARRSRSGALAGYGRFDVVRDIALKVGDAEAVALLGPNGAGKTTVLKAIMGLVKQRRGAIRVRGEDVSALPAHRIARGLAAIAPEGRRLLVDQTVEDNLLLGALHLRGDAKRVQTLLKSVYDLFPALYEYRRRLASYLSGGEQQMVAIGRMLMSDPEVMLLDEPSVALSPVAVDVVVKALLELRKRGASLLLVEQRIDIAVRVCDRLYVMTHGEIVDEMTPEDVRKEGMSIINKYLG